MNKNIAEEGEIMRLYIEHYITILLLVSFGLFFIGSWWMGVTNEPYRDLLLTIAVVHFVMWKLITIKKHEKNSN